MKKIILVLFSFFVMFLSCEACDYSDEVALSKLASYVSYSYDFKDNNKFSVSINNVPDELMIKYNDSMLNNSKGVILINDLEMGSALELSVYSTVYSACPDLNIRTLYVSLPYKNDFYDSNVCLNYSETEVCKNKFLNYKLTDIIFYDYISSYIVQKNEKKDQKSSSVIVPDNVAENIYVNSYLIIIIVSFGLILLCGILLIILNRKRFKF